jgi:hypothetical protein
MSSMSSMSSINMMMVCPNINMSSMDMDYSMLSSTMAKASVMTTPMPAAATSSTKLRPSVITITTPAANHGGQGTT